MIKQVDDQLVYWEVWQNGKQLIIHYGSVGDTGEREKKKLSPFQKGEKQMKELAKEKIKEGYDYLDEDTLYQLVIQYRYEEHQLEEKLDDRYHIESIMNECLGWTGNGACDGGDIGSGTINIFNYVVDPEKAAQIILEELEYIQLKEVEGTKIAYLNPKTEEYITLYPKGDDFKLL